MALVLKDRVKETSTTAGTGTITLAGAVAGFQSFSAVGNGNTTYYAIVDPTTGDWEVGIGTYTSSGTTLSRDTVLSSSNSGSLVSFAANQKDVFVTYPSEKSVYEDASNVVNATSFGAITATSAALTTGTVSTAPASGTDIANKTYVDTLVSSGITYHTPVKYEVPDSTGNLNATYNQPGGPGVGVGATLTNAGTLVAFTPDGTVATAGDRIIIYNQTNQFENGIYTVTTVGSGSVAWVLTRATDADTYALKSPNGLGNGDAFFITSGATGAGETYVCNTAGTITFGTTAITFAQISDSTLYTAGTGLTLTGTEFSITPTGTAGTYGSASSVPVLTTNASGQVTSVTNTTIAINGSQVSGNISGSAGSVANALTLGTYLTGGTYNGSAAVTATVDATSANTASKVVARDSNGDFSAGTITATLNGTATSTASATNLSGGAANQIAYQSAANTTAFATAPSASNQVLNWNGSAFTWSTGTISGVPLGSNLNSLTAGTYLTGTAYNGSAAQTWTVNAASANTASTVVARDASGNFSASTITASLSGNATTATTASTLNGYTQDTAATANTIVLRDSGGDIYQRYGFAVHFNQSSSNTENPTIGGFWTNSTADNYNRKSSPAHVISQLGLLTTSNYNSYAPTLTGTGASGTWNINVTGSAGSSGSVTGLTLTSSANGINPDSVTQNQLGYNTSVSLYGQTDGGLYSSAYSSSWIHQIYGDFRSGQIAVRGKNSGTWQSWYYIPTYSLNNGYSTGSLYAGIYYDANDTGYYIDPASTSNTALRMRGGALFGPNVTWGQYLYVGTDGNVDVNTATVAVTNGNLHLDARNGYVLYLNNYATSSYTVANQSIRSPIFYDYDNTAYYADFAGSTSLSLNGGISFATANPSLSAPSYFVIPGGAYFNSGTVYMEANLKARGGVGNDSAAALTLTGGTSGWTQINGSARSPIFYDSDNTGYYVDPASTSNLNAASFASSCSFTAGSYCAYMYGNGNTGSNSGVGMNVYSTGGNGAMMAFHRGGYYAVNMGLDSDNVFRIGGWSASANRLQMDMSGNLTMAGSVTAYSDETLKKDWADMPSDFVPRLARVKSGTYTRIDNEMRQIGVGAQSLRPLMEEAVFENADGTLSVAYGNAAMASSVELAKYVTALEQRISQLEARA